MTSNTKTSVLVGMSGGVDSTVCCSLLLDEGYDVQGLYCIMSDAHLLGADAAKQAAAELGVALEIADLRETFETNVTLPFMQAYCSGKTPNPCVVCNPLVKFRALVDTADRLGIDHIATGHYARVVERGGFFLLQKASETARDQSYMLYRLPQAVLSRLRLPLGDYTKNEVRVIAEENSNQSSTAPDSQEICFIPDGDYPTYLHEQGFFGKSGNFISPIGEVLDAHKGVEHYTVGQRKGLHLSLGQPVFVKEILDCGDIQLVYSGGEYANEVMITDNMINPYYKIDKMMKLDVKLRSMANAVPCKVVSVDADHFRMEFDERQRAPAPGQSAVLYQGDIVVGGGIIAAFQ